MEEEIHLICGNGQPQECELNGETNEYNSMSQVWVKEEMLIKQEVNDSDQEIKGKMNSYMEKDLTSSVQYKKGEITEEHEPILEAWVKQEIKLEPHDPSQAADEQKIQSENMPDSSDECKRENENVINEDAGENEETEFQDVKSVCETKEEELYSSDVELPMETMNMKYCCRQNMLLGRNCDLCAHAEKNFKCDICLKRFLHLYTLKKHKLLLHSDEGKFLCQTCVKQFKTNSELQTHLVSHSDIGSYPCSLCSMLFVQERELRKHLRTHSNDQRFKCGVCLRRFSRYTRLVEHGRLHTGEKPYKCNLCGKEFLRRSSMIYHERLHTGELLHTCDICKMKFSRRYQLVRHLRRHPQS